MTIAPGVVLPEAQIAEVCRRYHVKELSLFGSAARGELRPDSDVDLLVDFLPDARVGLLDLSALMRELAAAFAPVPVASMAAHGVNPKAIEAMAFALLAYTTVHGEPNNIPRVTGASRAAVLGKIIPI